MINNVHNVSSLYMTRGLAGVESKAASSSSESAVQDGGFGAVLANAASGAVNSLKNAESMSFAGIKGTATTREVVDSVMEAQQTLQTAIALRDKVVSAFLEITKMQM